MTAPFSREVTLTCPLDCPDACRLKVTLHTDEGGTERMATVTGDPDHATTRGFACAKTVHYPARQNHPERPLYPMKRVNGELVRVSWEVALSEIAARLRGILETSGPQAILPYHYAGTMGLREGTHVHSFFRALGACELDETICASAGTAAWSLGYGPRYGVDMQDVPHARTVILWGINSLSTNSHLTPWLTQARNQGARIWHIDPYRNRTSRFADVHLKLRPGTDAALCLGLIRELTQQGWHDAEYIVQATEGFEELRGAARPYTLEHTAEITGLEAADIAELARSMGEHSPTYIRVGYGMTRHENGGTALRAVSLLPAVTGDWRRRGGGCTLSTSGAFALNRTRLGAAHLIRPDARHVNMNALADALAPEGGTEALFVYNTNPAVVAPDSSRVRAGMQRPELMVVVLEQAMTETAQLADYLLPATTFAEHADLYTSYGHHTLGYNPATLQAPGEARPNSWVFAELGRRLKPDVPGLDIPELYWSLDTLMSALLDTDAPDTQHPYLKGVTPERLKTEGSVRLNLPAEFRPYAHGAPTPSGKVMFTPAPRYVPVRSQLTPEYPFRLLTPPAHHFMNSTYGNVARLNRAEGGEPQVMVHPQDAAQAGVQHGEYALIGSEQGQVRRRVQVTQDTQPGVLVVEGTWWGLSAPDGLSINTLTAQTLTDLGGGSTFHNTRVFLTPEQQTPTPVSPQKG